MSNDQIVHFNGRTYKVSVGTKQDILRALEPFQADSVRWDYVHRLGIKTVLAEEAKEPAPKQPDVLTSPSEAVFGFVTWITCSPTIITAGADSECSTWAALAGDFCKSQGFSEVRGSFPDMLAPYPPYDCLTKPDPESPVDPAAMSTEEALDAGVITEEDAESTSDNEEPTGDAEGPADPKDN